MTVVSNLCQSGEKVTTSGIYKMVEMTPTDETGTLSTLYRGDYFPLDQGREVCWYLFRAIPDRKATAPLHNDWQEQPSES